MSEGAHKRLKAALIKLRKGQREVERGLKSAEAALKQIKPETKKKRKKKKVGGGTRRIQQRRVGGGTRRLKRKVGGGTRR